MFFDHEHIYLQWLKLRRPFPVRFAVWYSALGWLIAFVLSPFWVIIGALDFFHFIPKVLHDDAANPMGKLILASPVRTEDIYQISRVGLEGLFLPMAGCWLW